MTTSIDLTGSTGHVVYTFRDDDGAPLYVGQTSNLFYRVSQHILGADWFPLAASIDVERCTDRFHALNLERETIAKLQPLHNTNLLDAESLFTPDGFDGAALRNQRQALGFSQTEFADMAGLTQPYVANLEAGRRRNPSTEALHKIAAALYREQVAA